MREVPGSITGTALLRTRMCRVASRGGDAQGSLKESPPRQNRCGEQGSSWKHISCHAERTDTMIVARRRGRRGASTRRECTCAQSVCACAQVVWRADRRQASNLEQKGLRDRNSPTFYLDPKWLRCLAECSTPTHTYIYQGDGQRLVHVHYT